MYIMKRAHFCSSNQSLCAFAELSQKFSLYARSNKLEYKVGYSYEM
jgi:hypothetical protein